MHPVGIQAGAPALTKKRRLGASVGKRLDVYQVTETYVVTGDGAVRAHREAMLAIQTVPLVLLAEHGESVFILRKHIDDAVPDAGSASNAFGFIYMYHGGTPPVRLSRTMQAYGGC